MVTSMFALLLIVLSYYIADKLEAKRKRTHVATRVRARDARAYNPNMLHL